MESIQPYQPWNPSRPTVQPTLPESTNTTPPYLQPSYTRVVFDRRCSLRRQLRCLQLRCLHTMACMIQTQDRWHFGRKYDRTCSFDGSGSGPFAAKLLSTLEHHNVDAHADARSKACDRHSSAPCHPSNTSPITAQFQVEGVWLPGLQTIGNRREGPGAVAIALVPRLALYDSKLVVQALSETKMLFVWCCDL